jgi:hypothetical protein
MPGMNNETHHHDEELNAKINGKSYLKRTKSNPEN